MDKLPVIDMLRNWYAIIKVINNLRGYNHDMIYQKKLNSIYLAHLLHSVLSYHRKEIKP